MLVDYLNRNGDTPGSVYGRCRNYCTFFPAIVLFLCGTVLLTVTNDMTLPVRNIIWCLSAIILVLFAKDIRVNFFAIGYLVFVVLSGIFAVNKSEWLYVVLRTGLFVAYICVIKPDEKFLSKMMIILGAVFIVVFWYDYAKIGDLNLCRGLMRQKNIWSAAHFFVIPFCYYAFEKKFWKWPAVGITSMMVLNIILLNCRSVILAIVISTLVVVLKNKSLRLYLLTLGVLGVIVILCVKSDKLLDSETLRQRVVQWKPTMTMIFDKPFGVGAGNWWIVFPDYAKDIDYPKAFLKEVFRFPHNDFLWVWAEMGLGGIVCFIGMFVCALRTKKTYILMAILGYIAIAFFGGPMDRTFPVIYLATILAMTPTKYTVRAKTLIIHVLIFAVIVFGFRFRAATYDKKMTGKIDWKYVDKLTKGYSPFSTLTYTGFPWYWYKAMANFKEGSRDIAMLQFRTAYEHNPYNIRAINGMGIVYGDTGEYEKALEMFQLAHDICPTFENAANNIAKAKKKLNIKRFYEMQNGNKLNKNM